MTNLLFITGTGALVIYLAILETKIVLSRRYARAHREDSRATGSITVMQPILSGDPFLETALRRNLDRAPPGACFLWLIDEDDHAAGQITDQLLAIAKGRSRVLRCPLVSGNLNPKTAKLQQGLREVQTDFVAILDDDTILDDDNLARALFCLGSCDLYTGLPCYLPGPNFWSALVAHFVNNNGIMTYLPLLDLVGPLSINGMFYVMRTGYLRDLGGFEPILANLCDDYALACLVKRRGGVVRQGTTPQSLRTTVTGVRQYLALMRRWFVFANILVRDQPSAVAALLFLFLGLPPLLLWLCLLSLVGGVAGALGLAAGLLVRHLALRGLHHGVFGRSLRLSWGLSVLSELLQPWHWAHACVGRTVRWRSRSIRVERDGRFSYINPQGP